MDKTITLNLTGLHVEGTVDALLWCGNIVKIYMEPFDVAIRDEIPAKVNDGGFGCQRILKAECHVYRNYEGHLVYEGDLILEADQLANAKRGV